MARSEVSRKGFTFKPLEIRKSLLEFCRFSYFPIVVYAATVKQN